MDDQKKNILFVEDRPIFMMPLKNSVGGRSFTYEIHNIAFLSNLQEAIGDIEAGKYDVVLMDCNILEGDTRETLARLLVNQCTTPIIDFSGGAKLTELFALRRLGKNSSNIDKELAVLLDGLENGSLWEERKGGYETRASLGRTFLEANRSV